MLTRLIPSELMTDLFKTVLSSAVFLFNIYCLIKFCLLVILIGFDD